MPFAGAMAPSAAMTARRHLPVLHQASATPAADAPSSAEEPPAWHWVPLGTTLSVLGFALLAQGAAALAVRILGRVYPPNATAAQITALRAARPAVAGGVELLAAMVPVAALLLATGAGAYVVGRRGAGTNARHGMLSAGLTVLLLWAVTGRLGSMLLLVPVAMALGLGCASWGAARRAAAD